MTHYMNLHPQPFSMIADQVKTIELRLCDEKRKKIQVGDTIIFRNTQEPERELKVVVTALHVFASFAELYEVLPLEKCGYLPEELSTASPEDMNMYYSDEQQQKYGVLGIELRLITS